MPREVVRQTSFGAGEFSPRTLGRTDIPQYPAGLKTMSNWIVHPQGSATRRPGFKHIAVAKALAPVSFSERSNPKNFDLLGVIWADELSLWCVLGDPDGTDAYIVTSPDGITWTERANPKNFRLAGIVWSGSLFVAVGDADGTDAYIVTSPDGTTWTERANPKNFRLRGIVWSGSLFVAVGDADGTDAYIVTSPDGITWTERANPKNLFLSGINWSGSLFVVVGETEVSDSYIITSPDGTTWTERANPATDSLNAITWASELSLWCAVGLLSGSGDANLITSPNAILWTERSNPKNFSLRGIVWSGSLFVAVGDADGTDAYIVTSPDGITWTERANPKNFRLRNVAWNGSLFVAVGDADGADAYILTSPGDTSNRRLITFVASSGSPYMMELGQAYIRFIRDGIQIESSPGTPLEIVSPWDGPDLSTLQFAQANDVMYLTHPSYTPRKLTRTGEATFTITDLMDPTTVTANRISSTFKTWDGPYLDENATVTTLELSSVGTGSKTLAASSALFASGDVGRSVRIFSEGGSEVWGFGVITAFTSDISVTIFITEDPNTSSPETRWMLGAWSETTGFPSAAVFFEQRLMFGNTKTEPMRIWGSKTGSFDEFDPTDPDDTVLADNGLAFTIASRKMLPIKWLEVAGDLYIGTKGGAFRVDGGEGVPLSPTNIRIRQSSGYGSDAILPALVGDVVVYIQQGKRIVRALSPQISIDILAQPNLTIIAGNVSKSGIEQIDFSSVPSSIVWMRRADGLLIGMTLNPETQILAFHTHQMPGSLTGADFPKVLSIAVLPLDGHDQLWIITRRTIDGTDVEHIEAIELPFDSNETDQEDALYLDAAVFYDGAATTAIAGLDHLEGESVHAYADGIVQGPFTVASGVITLDTAASVVWVGLDYEALSDLQTLPIKKLDFQSAKVRPISTLVEVLDTNGLQIGRDTATLSPLNPSLQPDTFVSGALKPLVTGDREHTLPGGTDTRPTVLIRPEGSLPATVIGLTHIIEYDHV